MANYIHFRTEHCNKYGFYGKQLQVKVGLELNCQQKSLWVHISISLGVELGSLKNWHGWNIIMYKNGKLYSRGQNAVKNIVQILWKKVSSKSCLKVNSLQNSQRAHMSPSSSSGARGSKDWHVRSIIM